MTYGTFGTSFARTYGIKSLASSFSFIETFNFFDVFELKVQLRCRHHGQHIKVVSDMLFTARGKSMFPTRRLFTRARESYCYSKGCLLIIPQGKKVYGCFYSRANSCVRIPSSSRKCGCTLVLPKYLGIQMTKGLFSCTRATRLESRALERLLGNARQNS